MENKKNPSIGDLLPEITVKENSIFKLLSNIHWTLIVCGKEKIKIQDKKLKILHVPENAYPARYILIRPDWHVMMAGNKTDTVMEFLGS